jgi:hypothetical protein
MLNTRKLLVVSVAIVLAVGAWAQAGPLGGKDYNDGSGNTDGLTYTQGSVTIGEAGANKAWSFSPIEWIDITDASSGSVFLSALVQRQRDEVQWGGVSFFNNAQNDEVMYFGAATSDTREFFGFHDQESGLQTASSILFSPGTTHLMVGELDLAAGEARLWIDPPFGTTAPAPDLTAAFALSSATEIGSIRMNAGGAAGFIIGDEVLSGTTWNDVVPVPEPSTLVLLGVAVLGLAFWRRKR